MEREIKQTAILKGTYYDHFGIHPKAACLYGIEPSEIKEITMVISEDQTKPSGGSNNSKEADYWGWFDNEKEKFTMIYPKYFLLDMCFPYGLESDEKLDRGKAYRLEIV